MRNSARIQQRLEELRQARLDLAGAAADASQIKDDLNPKNLLANSVRRHPWRWAAGGVTAGWILLRTVSSGKSRFSAKKTFTKGSLIGIIAGSMGGLLRIPVEAFVRHRLRDYFNHVMSGKAAMTSTESQAPPPAAPQARPASRNSNPSS